MILNLVWFLPRPIPAAGTTRVALGTETAQYACWETGFAVGNTSGVQGSPLLCIVGITWRAVPVSCWSTDDERPEVLGPPCFGGGKLVFIAV